MTSPDCSSKAVAESARRAGAALLALALVLCTKLALAIAPFVVKDIRVEGVQRTDPGTVFSYLPVKVGETLTAEKAQQALRALFVPAEGAPRHAAYQIVSLTPQGMTAADAEIRLFEAPLGQPAPIGGVARHLKLVKSGARWLVESWN